MVKASIILGVIVLVGILSIGLFVAFPLGGTASEATDSLSDTESAQIIDIDGIEEAADLFLLSYQDLIEDIASFQDDPSLGRAESRKNAAIDLAQDLIVRFQTLASELRGRLDELTLQSGEESSQ